MKGWQKFASAMILGVAAIVGGPGSSDAQTKPEGEMRFAVYVTIAPAWLDPGETSPGNLTPFWMHVCAARRAGEADAGQPHGAEPRRILDREPGQARSTNSSCARASNSTTATRSPPRTSSSASSAPRGRSSRRRSRRSSSSIRTRCGSSCNEPWPDFMTVYGTLWSAAGWITPKNYFEKVGAGRLQEASDRARPLQVRQHEAGHRTGAWRRTRITGARCRR